MASNTAMLQELAAARKQRMGSRKRSSSSSDRSQCSTSSLASYKSASSSDASSTSSKSSDYDKQELRTEVTPTSAISKRTTQQNSGFGEAARPLPKRLTSALTRDGNVFRHTASLTDSKTGDMATVSRTFFTHDGSARRPKAYRQSKVETTELGANGASAFAKDLGLEDTGARYKVFSDSRCKGRTATLDLNTGAEGFQQGLTNLTEHISGGVVSNGPINLKLATNPFNPNLTNLPRPPRPPQRRPFGDLPPPPPPPPHHHGSMPSGRELSYRGSALPPSPPPPPADTRSRDSASRRGSSASSQDISDSSDAGHNLPRLSPPAPRDWFTPFISPASRRSSDASTIDGCETVTVHKDGQISREATKHKRYRKTAIGVDPRTEMLVQSIEGPDREYHKDSLWRKKNGEVHRMTSDSIPKWGTRPDLFKIVQRHAGFPDESRVSAKITATRRKSWTKEQVKRHNAYPKACRTLREGWG